MIAALFSPLKFRVATGNKALKNLFRNVDFEWIKGVNCLSYQAWEGWLCLRWFWAQKLEHTNRGMRGMLSCRKWEPGAPFIGEAGRPGSTGLGGFVPLPGLVFFQHDLFSSMTSMTTCSTSCTAQTLSSTPFLTLLILPLDASCFESCSCSLAPLASHVTMNFLQSYACGPPMLVLCMWS
jgi:hypothetical protein